MKTVLDFATNSPFLTFFMCWLFFEGVECWIKAWRKQ